ncbi:MAG: HGxxPAAW family protein [Acidothermaceae bacterium]
MADQPADDLSVAERLEHVHGGPLAWSLVLVICAGFVAGGIGLIEATPWLFYVGIGVVVVAAIIGWVTHSLSAATTYVKPIRGHELSNSSENAAHH